MRIALLLSVLLLSACATTETPYQATSQVGNLKTAQAYCLSRGYVRGTYDYESCYNEQPAVEAHERTERLTSLRIIRTCKSPMRSLAHSLPVT